MTEYRKMRCLGPRSRQATVAVTLAAGLALAAQPTTAAAQDTKAPAPSPASRVAVEVVATGLAHPWGLQFLPDGRMLVTERPGRMRIVTREGKLSAPVVGVPKVAATGQGGLLDVRLANDFESSRHVFVSYAEPREGRDNGTAVARGRLVADGDEARLEDVEVIFRQDPSHRSGLHFGSRIVFDREGFLYLTLGDRYEMRFAQELGRHWGKVVRIRTDGTVPDDNPFVGRAGAKPEIWSYGHRNPQALALHPTTGALWLVDHGPRGGDEVNIVKRGANYGWPVVGYGVDYSGARIHQGTSREGMEPPVYYWVPSIAPSGMAFYTGDLFPAWRGNLLTGALSGEALHRLVLDGERIVGEEVLLESRQERIRDVRQGPDGAVWLLVDAANGKILRLTPAR